MRPGRVAAPSTGRREDHEAAFGLSIALCAASVLCAAGAALGASWDERVFPRLASRFRSGRRGRPIRPPRPHRARPRAVQGEVHHRRRRRTAKGDAGDHPDQAQERRQSAVQPHQRAGFEFLLRLPQRSDHRRLGRRRRQRVRVGGVRERPVRLHRPVVLERAAHDRADGRGPRRASGARDDRRPAGDPRRGDRRGLRDRQGRAAPTS